MKITRCKLNEISKNIHEGINEIELTDYMVKVKFKMGKESQRKLWRI